MKPTISRCFIESRATGTKQSRFLVLSRARCQYLRLCMRTVAELAISKNYTRYVLN